MTTITGAILAAVVVGAYLKYKPSIRTYGFQTLAVAAGTAVLSMVIPLAGVLQWLGLAVQLTMLGCVVAAMREYRLKKADRQHHWECRDLGNEIRWKKEKWEL